jgi:N-acetylglucosamine-6-sulfatase
MNIKRIPCLVGLFIALANVLAADESKKPDILFILLDDLRWDAMSFMGHPYIETPNIDSLREAGAHMSNAFVTTSICCPSRATFLTGTLANQHGVIDNETSEYNPDVTPPVSMYLQQVGYKTAMIGKWHMGNSGRPRPYFDFWLSFDGQGVYNDPHFNIDGQELKHEGYTTDLLTDYAIDFIENQPTDEPYFCMLSHKAVHEPFQPAPRHKNAFGAKTMDPEPESWSEDFADKPDWHKRQRSRDVRWDYRTRDYQEESLPESIPQEKWVQRNKYVKQLRCAAAVDDGIGRILELLRERGTLDNTLIVFASDNGYFHMEHRRWDKRLAYEESLRIPLVITYPGKIAAGSTINQLVTNADFAPTVLSYAGVEIPEHMQGSNMRPLFEEETPEWRESVFYEYWKELVHAIPTMTAVRTERYKLITFPELDDIDELYDLETDPHEMNNLATNPEHQALLQSMQERLQDSQSAYNWRKDVFPKNLPRVRGESGTLLDLVSENGELIDKAESGLNIHGKGLGFVDGNMRFDGKGSYIKVPYNKLTDPAGWPFHIEVSVKPETDGVIAVQSTKGYGFKIFIEDGRPGVAVHCKTWVDTTTTLDAPDSIIGEWTDLGVLIDYNRLSLTVNGKEVESISLPLPFKGSPKTPLVIGAAGSHPVVKGLTDEAFAGEISRFTLKRGQ